MGAKAQPLRPFPVRKPAFQRSNHTILHTESQKAPKIFGYIADIE
jgi:hypothetical protein